MKPLEVLGFGLPVGMICPSHGVIWKDDPTQIVHQYLSWANAYRENQITIVYDSMWGATRLMAEAIASGIIEQDRRVTVKLLNAAKEDKNDIITEIFRSKMVLVGSSTINRGYLYSIGGLLEMIKGLKFARKCAAAFGSYGWSGEAVDQLTQSLRDAGFAVTEGLKALWKPNSAALTECMEYGRKIAGIKDDGIENT